VPRDAADRARAANALEQAREALACCVIPGAGFEAVAAGFGRSYARARAAFAAARAGEDIELRHTWRKRAKVHWYHLRLLEPLWPALVESLAAESKRLTEALGDERDLFTLASLARAHAPVGLPPAYGAAIEERRAAALRRADQLAARLFARRRRDTVEHFARLWRVWRTGRGRSGRDRSGAAPSA
jgi:CHAD domain-containing protein